MNEYEINRGDIFYIYKYAEQVGSEQASGRPAIVVSNNLCNKHSEVVEVVYCTTQPKTDLPTHVKIRSTYKESVALCEQIVSVDKSRIGDYVGSCTKQEMESMSAALMISIGIDDYEPRSAPPSCGQGEQRREQQENNGADYSERYIQEYVRRPA